MSVKYDVAIIDTDFALKIGQMKDERIIETVIPTFCNKLYIHKYVYENEILTPPIVKEQIDFLHKQGNAIVVDQTFLSNLKGNYELIYEQTRDLLKENLGDDTNYRKNWGEIVSLAFAKAIGIKAFLSDEKGLQGIVDDHLNIGDENDILVIRIQDFVLWMKDNGFDRKSCKQLWIISSESKDDVDLANRKKVFDCEMWPL